MENRFIMAALSHVLGEKKSAKHQPGDNFWKIVPVRLLLWATVNDSQDIENKIFQVSESCSDAYFFSVIIYCMWQN